MSPLKMGRKLMSLVVRARWDEEARVWVATSDDVPGLATEADTLEELHRKLLVIVPELMEANAPTQGDRVEVPLYIISERLTKVRIPTTV